MSEDMRLFFFWLRIRHDLRRRACDQGQKTLHEAILTAQRIEAADAHDMHTPGNLSHDHTNTMPAATPMDIDVQNAHLHAKRGLPERDSHRRPKVSIATTMATSDVTAGSGKINNISKTSN